MSSVRGAGSLVPTLTPGELATVARLATAMIAQQQQRELRGEDQPFRRAHTARWLPQPFDFETGTFAPGGRRAGAPGSPFS
jgi:hypothetical protein